MNPCDDGASQGDRNIMDPAEQRRMHEEIHEAIRDLRQKTEKLMVYNEMQTRAILTIFGISSLTDMDAMLTVREEHKRWRQYDRRIADATQTFANWMMRFFVAGAILLMIAGMSLVGLTDIIKDWIRQ